MGNNLIKENNINITNKSIEDLSKITDYIILDKITNNDLDNWLNNYITNNKNRVLINKFTELCKLNKIIQINNMLSWDNPNIILFSSQCAYYNYIEIVKKHEYKYLYNLLLSAYPTNNDIYIDYNTNIPFDDNLYDISFFTKDNNKFVISFLYPNKTNKLIKYLINKCLENDDLYAKCVIENINIKN